MSQTLNDIYNAVNAFVGDASLGGTTEQTRKLFAINTAKDYLISMIGLPSSEVTQTISYIDNNNFYPITSGMLEPISLRYNPSQGQANNNVRANNRRSFEYMHTDELYEVQELQANDMVYWGIDYGNNTNQLAIITNNIIPSVQLNALDQLTGLHALGDASGLALDTNVYKSGNAATSFTITYSGGRAYIQYQLPTPTDFTQYLNTGLFSADWFVQSTTGLTNINIQFGSDAVSSVSPSPVFSNYWKISATTQTSGVSFVADAWNDISWNWANASVIGTPDVTKITYFQIEIDITNIFPTTILWRLDDLELYSPDQMTFSFYSNLLVQDGITNLYKADFANNSDIALFANIDPSIIRVMAAYAAMIYKPTSLQMDSQFVQKIAEQGIQNLQYRFPKKTLPYLQRLRVITR